MTEPPTRVVQTQKEVCRHQKSKSSAPKTENPRQGEGSRGRLAKITDQRSAKDDNQTNYLNLIIADRLGLARPPPRVICLFNQGSLMNNTQIRDPRAFLRVAAMRRPRRLSEPSGREPSQ